MSILTYIPLTNIDERFTDFFVFLCLCVLVYNYTV